MDVKRTYFKEVNNLSDYIKIFEEIERDKHEPAQLIRENRNIIRPNYFYRGMNTHHPDNVASAFRQKYRYSNVANSKGYKNFKVNISLFFNEISHEITELEKKSFLAFSQHHGLPTNLLDVTKNPLTALFFACYKHELRQSDFGIVEMFSDFIDLTQIIEKDPSATLLHLLMVANIDDRNIFIDCLNRFEVPKLNPLTFYITNIYQRLPELINDYLNEEKNDSYKNNYLIKLRQLLKHHTFFHQVSQKIWPTNQDYDRLFTLMNGFLVSATGNGYYDDTDSNAATRLISGQNGRHSELYELFLRFYLHVLPIDEEIHDNVLPLIIYRLSTQFKRSNLQKGSFIFQPYLIEERYDHGEDDVLFLKQNVKEFKMIKINNQKQILKQLNAIGINEGSIFGDFDSIARSILKNNE